MDSADLSDVESVDRVSDEGGESESEGEQISLFELDAAESPWPSGIAPRDIDPLQAIKPVKVREWYSWRITGYRALFWKLNIMACFGDYVFVACDDRVLVFLQSGEVVCEMVQPNGAEINQIRVGAMGDDKNAVMAVGDRGRVCIWFIDCMVQRLQEERAISSERVQLNPNVTLRNESESTWSLAMHAAGPYVIVGANNRKITLWNLRTGGHDEDSGQRLEKHGHNVPCVDFSSCGRFIVSASIDGRVRILRVSDGRIIACEAPSREWGWSCRFVDSRYFRTTSYFDEQINPETNRDRLMSITEYWLGPSLRRPDALLANADDDHYSVESLDFDNGDDDHERDEEVEDHFENGSDDREDEGVEERGREVEKKHVEDATDFPQEFVIYTSKHHLMLLDSRLRLLDSVYYNPFRSAQRFLPQWMRSLSRLSFLEYLPEINCVLIVSQSDSKVLVLRIATNGEGKYALVPENTIPNAVVNYDVGHTGEDNDEEYVFGDYTSRDVIPVCGMCAQRLSEGRYAVHILKIDRSVFSYELSTDMRHDNGGINVDNINV